MALEGLLGHCKPLCLAGLLVPCCAGCGVAQRTHRAAVVGAAGSNRGVPLLAVALASASSEPPLRACGFPSAAAASAASTAIGLSTMLQAAAVWLPGFATA